MLRISLTDLGVFLLIFNSLKRANRIINLRCSRKSSACFEESSQLREKREAFADLHQLAIEEPGNSGTLVQLGKVAAELGKYKLAQHWCTSALQIDSGNIEAQQTLAQIQQQMQQQSLSPDSSTDAVTPN